LSLAGIEPRLNGCQPQPIQNEPSWLRTSSEQYESLQSLRDNTFCGSLFSAWLGLPATLLADQCTSWKDKWEVEVPLKYCGCGWHLVSVSQSIRMSQGWARLTALNQISFCNRWMKSCTFRRHDGTYGSLILHLGTRYRQVVSFTPRPLYPRQRNPVPVEQKAGWATRPVWPVWRGLKFLNLLGFEPRAVYKFIKKHKWCRVWRRNGGVYLENSCPPLETEPRFQPGSSDCNDGAVRARRDRSVDPWHPWGTRQVWLHQSPVTRGCNM